MGIALSQVPAGDIVDITYTDLLDALTNPSPAMPLQPTKLYAITDYRTYFWLPNALGTLELWGTLPAPPTETLIVLATAVDKIDNQVYSAEHPDDTILFDPLYNVGGATGRIYYRKNNTKNVATPYDFRQVKFRRWQQGSEVSGRYSLPRYNNNLFGHSATPITATAPSNFQDYFTFGGLTLNLTPFSNIEIEKLTEEFMTLNSIDPLELNNIVFVNPGTRFEQIQIGANNFRNTFTSAGAYDVQIKHSCVNNRFFATINRLNLGTNFQRNDVVGTAFTQNTIADRCQFNTWSGAQINQNKIEDDFNNNQILANFQRNVIARNFNLNITNANVEDCTFTRPGVGNYSWNNALSFRRLDIDYSNIESTVLVNSPLSTTLDFALMPYTGIFYVQSQNDLTSETVELILNPPSHPFELRPIQNTNHLTLNLDMAGQVTETQVANGMSLATPVFSIRSIKRDWIKIRRIGTLNVQVDAQNYH
jgi:hypothetical protein